MPAGRATCERNPVRVTIVLGDALLCSRDRTLDVDDLIGPGGTRARPIVDRHADTTQLGPEAHQRVCLSTFVSNHQGTPGNLQQHWNLSTAVQVGTSPNVEMVPGTSLPVTDVGVMRITAVGPQHPRNSGILRSGNTGPLPQVAQFSATTGAQAQRPIPRSTACWPCTRCGADPTTPVMTVPNQLAVFTVYPRWLPTRIHRKYR
nr:hypothetical protein [Mycobacterium lepromatosis]